MLKYLKRMRDYILVYSSGSLGILGYIDSDFQGDINSSKIAYEENIANPFGIKLAFITIPVDTLSFRYYKCFGIPF